MNSDQKRLAVSVRSAIHLKIVALKNDYTKFYYKKKTDLKETNSKKLCLC